MNFYVATVNWYFHDDVEPNKTNKIVIAAEDYVSAMEHIKNMYGDDIIDISIKELWVEGSNIVRLSSNTLEAFAKDYEELNV